jgi:hypothetical protein
MARATKAAGQQLQYCGSERYAIRIDSVQAKLAQPGRTMSTPSCGATAPHGILPSWNGVVADQRIDSRPAGDSFGYVNRAPGVA